MDVLRPQIIPIGTRCFRKNPLHSKYKTEVTSSSDNQMQHSMAALEEDVYCDEVCDDFTNIEETPNGFQTQLLIPSAYFKFLIGKKGETKRRLENETHTQIRIPRQGQEGPVVIQGHDRKGVSSAKNRVDILVESARQKQSFTHFLSIPINSTKVKDKFLEFKEDVLRFCDGDRGVDGSLFQNPHKLHMTLGTLALMNDAEINKAVELLHQCHQELIQPMLRNEPLVTQVRGLEYMNDDPSAVDVLYAKIQTHAASDKLQILADRLVDRLSAAGLMQQQYDRVKLHITVINTLFRKEPGGMSTGFNGDRRPQRERESFNATNILKNYCDYDFGAYTIDSVHLSQRYSTANDGYYSPAAVLNLHS